MDGQILEGVRPGKPLKKRYLILIALAVVFVYIIAQDWRLGGGADPQKTDSGIAAVSGREVKVEYVSKEKIYPAFGLAFIGSIEVREDLSPRVKRFVRSHELYHAGDTAKWGGWMGKEIRANLIPGMVDPAGFCSTVIASLTRERLGFYWGRFMRSR